MRGAEAGGAPVRQGLRGAAAAIAAAAIAAAAGAGVGREAVVKGDAKGHEGSVQVAEVHRQVALGGAGVGQLAEGQGWHARLQAGGRACVRGRVCGVLRLFRAAFAWHLHAHVLDAAFVGRFVRVCAGVSKSVRVCAR